MINVIKLISTENDLQNRTIYFVNNQDMVKISQQMRRNTDRKAYNRLSIYNFKYRDK